MRVTCTSNQTSDRNLQITMGRAYDVAQVVFENPAGVILMRLRGDDDEVPGLYESCCFEMTDPKVPSHWVFLQHPISGSYCLGPESFTEPGFWEAFFDGAQTALDVFQTEA